MSVSPHIVFSGNAQEAIAFYEEVFDTKANIMSFKDMPEDPEFPVSEEMKDQVMHAEIEIAGGKILMSDDPMAEELEYNNKIAIALFLKDEEEMKRMFDDLAKDGGKVVMPLEETFWSRLFGMVTDKFDVEWLFNKE